ncbi:MULTISPECIES: hypothetical protein [unclassified Bradyrhizobium]|uniref:hypothetical protein n=1 Tax=unclassified Bradyrhizobium TaxID=2631580 RepID=UPI00339ADD99
MEAERPLETESQDIGQQEKRRPIFNQHHRQMLDPLRDRDWVSVSKLPDQPGTTLALLRNGWMEQRSTGEGVEYRMTEAGLTELSRPR